METDQYRISKFEPSLAKKDCVWLLIGARNTGKTVLMRDLLYQTRSHYDIGMAMTATVSTIQTLQEFLPSRLIFSDGYDFVFGDKFLLTSKEFVDKKKERHTLLVLDDCMFNNKVMKTETQKNLHMNGRHYKITLFNTTQYCMIIPSDIRSNIDYVFALREGIMANRKRLFEYFFGMFPSFTEFNKVFTACTQNFGALVLDKTKSGTSVPDCIRWYAADPVPKPFRIGRPIFFRLSRMVDDANAKEEQKKEVQGMETVTVQR